MSSLPVHQFRTEIDPESLHSRLPLFTAHNFNITMHFDSTQFTSHHDSPTHNLRSRQTSTFHERHRANERKYIKIYYPYLPSAYTAP